MPRYVVERIFPEGLGIPAGSLPNSNLVAVRLRHGPADYKAFTAAAKAIGGDQIFVGDQGNVVGTTTAASSIQSVAPHGGR